ncbi:MAG TPA: GntR family transcriptional regulator [Acholeplasmataceae bacterium]|nr:GntR family transcriptional regulator [Acholeplasmataceae bacterium]
MNYIKIDKTIKKAFYLQIKDSIEDAIKKGILSDNDRLPTESELCEVYGISDIVVKNAYKLLVKEGYIVRVQGSGTFVSTRKIFRFPLAGFDKLSSFSNYHYQAKSKRVILFDRAADDLQVIDQLQLHENNTYIVVKYIVLIENAEVLFQTLYLPDELFPGLTLQDIEQNTLPDLLTKRFSHQIKHVKNGFTPMNLSSSLALLLNTYKNAAAHKVKTIIFNQQEQPIALLETLFLGQYTQFEVIL